MKKIDIIQISINTAIIFLFTLSILPFESKYLGSGIGNIELFGSYNNNIFVKMKNTSLGGMDMGTHWYQYDINNNIYFEIENEKLYPDESKINFEKYWDLNVPYADSESLIKIVKKLLSDRYLRYNQIQCPVPFPIIFANVNDLRFVCIGKEGIYNINNMEGYNLYGFESNAFKIDLFWLAVYCRFALILAALKILLSLISAIFKMARKHDDKSKYRHVLYTVISLIILILYLSSLIEFNIIQVMILYALLCILHDLYFRFKNNLMHLTTAST